MDCSTPAGVVTKSPVADETPRVELELEERLRAVITAHADSLEREELVAGVRRMLAVAGRSPR